MTTVAAAIIAYQAEDKIKFLLESLKDKVDSIVVAIDPKTTDATRAVAESFGATVIDGLDVMVDGFAAAREKSFAAVDADWILWIDTDDVLAQDIPLQQLCDEQPPNVGMIWLPYLYHRDEYGNATTIFDRERLIRKSAYTKWIGMIHETCQSSLGNTRDERVWIEHSNRTEEGKGERNFTLLRRSIELDPNDHRAVLYLGHQYFAGQDWYNACQHYEQFIALSSPGDVLEEKWQAIIYLTKARRSLGDVDGSIRAAKEALMMCPQYADAYFELSHSYAVKHDWQRSIYWHEEGLLKKKPDRLLIQNPLDYSFNPFVVVVNAYREQGMLDKALDAATKAVALRPNDRNLVNSYVQSSWQLDRENVVRSAVQMVDFLLECNEPLKAERILTALPAGVDSPQIAEAQAKIAARLAHLKDEVEYENFYFASEESGDPLEKLDKPFPRSDWILARLKAMGAKKVLDVGVGDGVIPFRLARAGIKVVGIDIDPRRVQQANKNAVRGGFLTESYKEEHRATTPDFNDQTMVQFRYGAAESVPDVVKDLGPYDAIILGELLEHVPDPDAVLDEMASLGGHILITTPDGASSYQYFENKVNPASNHSGHVRAYSQLELENLTFKRGRLVESHILEDTPYIIVNEYAPKESVLDRPPVVIYCGPGLEDWTPDQIDGKGLGGSETAVVKLAEEMVARNLRVMVYGPTEGVWNGVYYRHHSKFNPGNPILAFIAWRNPALFDANVNAQLHYLWAHDTDFGPNLTEERAAKITAVMALSKWHVKHLTELYPFIKDKTLIVGNGIDPSRFAGTEERTLTRFVYTSSPDRGLEQALTYWPKVREAIPDATLDIFYGWENYSAMRGDLAYKQHIFELAKQPGVTWRGRVGQKQLARELMQSGAMFYPGPHSFNETFCIAALEAQAAGCLPVTRDNGALPETNARGIVVPNDAPVEQWVQALVKTLTAKKDRRQAKAYALEQTWTAVADRLLTHFRDTMNSRAEVAA